MTLVKPISLSSALQAIAQYAFRTNPYPIILTIENHVKKQQRVMADIFIKTLGDKLYIPSANLTAFPFPSPNQLKGKILLRGKASSTLVEEAPQVYASQNGTEESQRQTSVIDSYFGRLIALRQIKLSDNLYADMQQRMKALNLNCQILNLDPINASPSISESKVESYLEANSPLASYTSTHFVKSYPSSVRQDSSNMCPIPSLLCGVQSIAMNFQTPDEGFDLINGLFMINGGAGYVLKPEILLEGRGTGTLNYTKRFKL
jgi:hypothetical protein